MRIRAIIIGLAAAAFVAGFTYFNDNIMRQTLFIGNHMPHSVYGALILFVLAVNPLLGWLRRSWRLSGAELALVLAMALSACAIPAAGLMRFFTNAVMLPHQMVKSKPAWQSEEILGTVPEYMLAGIPVEYVSGDVLQPGELYAKLAEPDSDAAKRIRGLLGERRGPLIEASAGGGETRAEALADALNHVLGEPALYDPDAFSDVAIPLEAVALLRRGAKRAGGAVSIDTVRPPATVTARLSTREIRTLNRHLIDAVWPTLVRSHSRQSEEALHTFVFGKSRDARPVGLQGVPWSAWHRPLAFWLPLVLIFSIGTIGLATVVHRQWSDFEHLPYPIARFASVLLPTDGETAPLLRNRMFLGVAGVLFLMHMNNYGCAWWSERFVPVQRSFDFSPLQPLFPMLSGAVARWALFTVRFFPAVIGLSYFVASDVSFSLGIAPLMAALVSGGLTQYGVTISRSGLYSGSPRQTFAVGAYVGLLLMFLYAGRRFYATVARRAFCLPAEDDAPRDAVWGARVVVFCSLGVTAYLMAVGVPVHLAVPYTALAFTLFLVMSRILAETGMFFLEPRWFPCAFLVVTFGIRSVGVQAALLMFLFSTVLMVVPREALMPFVVNSLKVTQEKQVANGRTACLCAVAFVLAMAVAVPVTLMFQYGAGTHQWDVWGARAVPRYSFDRAVEIKQRLRAQDLLAETETSGALRRAARTSPEPGPVLGFAIGLGVALCLAAARLRWHRWPLHPVLLIGFWNYPCVMFWHSFLLGWLLKKLVVRYGGQKLYRALVPGMFGLVAGDLLGMLAPSLIGTIYYLTTGNPAPAYVVMPD